MAPLNDPSQLADLASKAVATAFEKLAEGTATAAGLRLIELVQKNLSGDEFAMGTLNEVRKDPTDGRRVHALTGVLQEAIKDSSFEFALNAAIQMGDIALSSNQQALVIADIKGSKAVNIAGRDVNTRQIRVTLVGAGAAALVALLVLGVVKPVAQGGVPFGLDTLPFLNHVVPVASSEFTADNGFRYSAQISRLGFEPPNANVGTVTIDVVIRNLQSDRDVPYPPKENMPVIYVPVSQAGGMGGDDSTIPGWKTTVFLNLLDRNDSCGSLDQSTVGGIAAGSAWHIRCKMGTEVHRGATSSVRVLIFLFPNGASSQKLVELRVPPGPV
jgi:hypothetical protein